MNDAELIAANTGDAYMAADYGVAEWTFCANELLDRGLTQAEVEAFLRSKHMRWANDFAGEATANGLRAYLAGGWFKDRRGNRLDLKIEAAELAL